jgi:hypothetical protein
MTGILGGALVPHAPQFFSLPETEHKAGSTTPSASR